MTLTLHGLKMEKIEEVKLKPTSNKDIIKNLRKVYYLGFINASCIFLSRHKITDISDFNCAIISAP